MGPISSNAVAVQTTVELGSRPWSTRTVWVPLNQLSRSMQSIHNRGMSIQSIAGHSSTSQGNAVINSSSVDSPEPSRKAAKRGGRRRRS